MRARITVLLVVAAVLAAGCALEDASEAPSTVEEVDADVAEEPADAEDPDAAQAPGDAAQAADLDGIAAAATRRIIRDATVELVVEDPDEAVDEIGALARRVGGFVADADLRRPTDEPLRGSITLRVPADELDAVIDELRALALVDESVRISARDVTGEYQDLEARLRNLRSYEAELLELLGTVRDREDASAEGLLNVFERVREVRQEIEQLQGRLDALDEMVSLSTVRVELRTPREAAVLGDPADVWQPLEVLTAAARSLLTVLQGIGTVAIWLAVFVLPLALVVGVPLVGVPLLAARRWRIRQHAADG
jgi:hypothetical protein